MAVLDAMTIRLHLRAMRVVEVVEDLPERLVVAVVAVSNVIRCGACGFKTARVHATRKVQGGGPARVRSAYDAAVAPAAVPL